LTSEHLEITWLDQTLWLFSERAIFWKEKEMLLFSDCHFGKASHFQKHGINLHGGAERKDLQRIRSLTELTKAKKIVFLGDLFHSKMNDSWDELASHFNSIKAEKILVKGNHDILSEANYEKAGLNVVEYLLEPPFCFTHEPGPFPNNDYYVLAGHVHPAVTLRGKRSFLSVTAPCFYFGEEYGVLPAFGSLTGNEIIKPGKKDKVFIIAGNGVFPLS
jgi:uncharacterized protein